MVCSVLPFLEEPPGIDLGIYARVDSWTRSEGEAARVDRAEGSDVSPKYTILRGLEGVGASL